MKTAINLQTALVGESLARNRYDWHAGVARREGYELVARIFEETADQEREHAERLVKFQRALRSGEAGVAPDMPVCPGSAFPLGAVGATAENLRLAVAGEHYEQEVMYPAYARQAREDGLPEIAAALEAIAVGEAFHEKRFKILLARLESGQMFERAHAVVWRCLNCGYVYKGVAALDPCPACAHSRAYAEVLNEGFPY